MAWVVTFRIWERRRPISEKSTRINWPRRGTSRPQQLFHREAEGVLLVHRRDVVEAVEVADVLEIGACLDQLLGAAVK